MSTPPLPTMSAPPPPPPTAAKSRRGCLIAVLVVVLLMMAGCGFCCYYVVTKPGRVAAMSLGMGRDEIVATVSTSATEQQKADFAAEYDAYVAFLREIDMPKMQALGEDAKKLFTPAEFIGEASKDKQISPDEVVRFIELSKGARELIK